MTVTWHAQGLPPPWTLCWASTAGRVVIAWHTGRGWRNRVTSLAIAPGEVSHWAVLEVPEPPGPQ